MRGFLSLLVSCLFVVSVGAHPTNTGYSGAPGRQTCAASCHGIPGGTVQVFGFPTSYVPGEEYLVTIKKMSGLPIKNFNASCRIGTGTQNAGIISEGLLTAPYNVFGETNGTHMTTIDHDSAQFTWTAPTNGVGVVRLYVGAHQGERNTGPNTTLVVVSTQAAIPPGQASGPSPGDGATGVSPSEGLHWTAGQGATFHDIYFGTENPPPLLAQWFEGVFFDPEPDMSPSTTYYWRIDARNDAGVTPGNIWSFTIMGAPGMATNPIPPDLAIDVLPSIILEWTPGTDAMSHDLFFGIESDPPFLVNVIQPTHLPGDLLPGTTYYWRVDERNDVGVAPGLVWQFVTMPAPLAASDPHPIDGANGVLTDVVLSWTGDPTATQFDVYFDIQNPPLELAGSVQVNSYDPFGLLEPLTTYYWSVTSISQAGATPGSVWAFTTEASAADDGSATLPSQYALGPIYPNPFNAEATISFALPQTSNIRLAVHDVLGREVAVLASGNWPAGRHAIPWNAQNVSSGIYLVRLAHPAGVLTEKVAALK